MPVLRPMLMPTAGIPQPVMASRRPRNMTQRDFYQFQPGQQLQQLPDPASFQSAQQTRTSAIPQQEFEQQPVTGDYLQEQLARFSQRAAPPTLEPGARVKSANAELVQPSNFQVFYEQLQAIQQSGDEMLGAESARAAYKRMLEMQRVADMQAPSFGGLPVGYRNQGRGGNGGRPIKSLTKGGNTPLSGGREQARRIMQQMAAQIGWTGREWDALYKLIMKESGFNPGAANPTSSARGLFQKMVSIHGPLENSIEGQIRWGFNYIKGRYGSPSRALQFHLGHNWY